MMMDDSEAGSIIIPIDHHHDDHIPINYLALKTSLMTIKKTSSLRRKKTWWEIMAKVEVLILIGGGFLILINLKHIG
jgi:hypothetical protein